MALELYSFAPSAPARMVLLLTKHLNLSVKVTNVDLFQQEQLKPEYIAINPQHTIPTLVDDGFVLTESRAILMYLANKYGKKDESLYPKDPKKRAIVDMRLFFDVSTLFHRYMEAYYPVLRQKVKPDPEKLAKLDEALGYVEEFLKDGYIAGSELTIADFSAAVSLSTLKASGVEMSKYPKINAYLEKCSNTMKDWDEINQRGADMVGQFVKAALAVLDV